MFDQITIFALDKDSALHDAQALSEFLEPKQHAPIGATQEKSVGFVPPRGKEHGALVESIGGHYIMRLAIETKSVPSRTLREKADEKAAEIKASTGRKPGKKEMRELKEDALLALLPAAFPKRTDVTIWLDTKASRLVIGSASQGKLDTVASALCDVIPDIRLSYLQTTTSPQAAMTQWLLAADPEDWPADLTVERETVLKSNGEDGATVKFSKHHLATEEVKKHVMEGKLPTQLALSWDGKASFVLTDTFKLKKVNFLDGVMDESGTDKHEDRFDGDVALSTGLLGPLIDSLVDALGGVMKVGEP